jgi:predicted exporter
MKIAAFAWLAIVASLGALLILRLHRGIELQTNMTALLPLEERDPVVSRAKEKVTELLTQRIFVLIGDRDPSQARAAGAMLADDLGASGMTRSITYRIPPNSLKALGEMYFPYRYGLLTEGDRNLLEHNQGAQIVDRAIASIYGPSSIADATLLRHDPFLLLPEFMSRLPLPASGLTADDGILATREDDVTWVLLVAQLNDDVFAGAFQDRFISSFDRWCRQLSAVTPSLQLLRVGAIFYAQAGAQSATTEAVHLSIVSIVGTIALILLVFRALRPLWLMVVAIAVGCLCAFAICLSVFGGLHAVVLLFGIGLNGIAIDYCLQYVSARFGADAGTPADRLRQVFPGIALGASTTLIGYATLMLAPFPGLIQLAVFSAVGLISSFITIVLWLPFLDSFEPLTPGKRILPMANQLWVFWNDARYRRARWGAMALLAAATTIGALRVSIDNDVRHQQALASRLREQEAHFRRLTQVSGGNQFLLVRAKDRDRTLQIEEALLAPLEYARERGGLRGFQTLAQFIPSITRQGENRTLVTDKLMRPYLATHYQRLGISGAAQPGDNVAGYLTPDAIGADSPIAFMRNLIVESEAAGTTNLVLLTDVAHPDAIQRIADGAQGVRLVDPAEDISALLKAYHMRAMILIGVSVLLMMPVLIWRYGARGGLRAILPPTIAVIATPPLLALAGMRFSFFSAVGLVLVLSIGFDYSVFCRETDTSRRPVTMLGILLAMVTTLLSFGLLAFSGTYAVRSFGATLLVGTTLAFALSPIASDSTR